MTTAMHTALGQQAIDPAAALPPVYSLLTAAPALDLPGEDWLSGSKWLPELTRTSGGLSNGAVAIDCIGDTQTGMTAEDAPTVQDLFPFAVFGSFRCSATAFQTADYAGRARRLLDATQSYNIAKELWSGAINAGAYALGNGQLNAANPTTDTLSAAAVAPDVAFALIEQGIAYYGHGRRGMIHCTPQVFYIAMENGSITRQGGRWVTPMGNIVVADAGYDGSAPGGAAAGASQWIYGTEVIDVLLSPVINLPNAALVDDDAAFMAEALDREINRVTVYAFRAAAIRWDQQIHVAAQVNLAIPAYG